MDCTWHLLDNGVTDPHLTLLCVHGNPSWSFLWRRLVAEAPDGVRVVAVDQLDMGYSQRTGVVRRLADRIDDLVALTDHLGIIGPVVTVAHDWGGPISLGWAQRVFASEPARLRGIVLTNTAVQQPEGSPVPTLIRSARLPGVLRRVTVDTTLFIRGAVEMSRPRLAPEVRHGFLAPYASAQRREAIADFVEDIPLDDAHPSHGALAEVASGLDALAEVPALLLWGPSDKVFSDRYLHDLEGRLPKASVHRFVGASHFVSEEADVVGAIVDWIATLTDDLSRSDPDASDGPGREPLWAALERAVEDPERSKRPAVVELSGERIRRIDFGELARRVRSTAAGLVEVGVRPGDRVALMIPPGIDLTVVLYACWRMGAVIVLVDSGLGPRNMSRALASSNPEHLIGIPKAIVVAAALRWPGRRIVAGALPPAVRRALHVDYTIDDLMTLGADRLLPVEPADDDLAAIAFTSGSTGPSKGVVYRHRQIQAQRDILADLYDITDRDRLVAAFAPFALYGPTLGITSVVPDMDVTRPGTLDAAALGAAVAAVDATLVFASPAALVNVVATDSGLTATHRRALARVRLLLSAGAPVNPDLLGRACALVPNAEAHTPYGMTEVLPVTDISLAELVSLDRGVGADRGVCVGRPGHGVTVAISRLDATGSAVGAPEHEIDVIGEILVSAPHCKDHYDRLAVTELRSSTPEGWHRTGDVGSLDSGGRLWVGGRLEHLITTATALWQPVPLELAAESLGTVRRACAVGIGPAGAQVIAIAVELDPPVRRSQLANLASSDAIRAAIKASCGVEPVMVLAVPLLPVDRRHNSKIDRAPVARWAAAIAAGDRIGRL
ncbi:MAG: alpha/beta fold hydrolase [Acidimicrobiales bacterium]